MSASGSELLLPPDLAAEMAEIYAALQADYERVAGLIGLTCADCPDNCCDSYFSHYTYCEWAFLWQGLRELDAATLADIEGRARAWREEAARAVAAGERPQIMCPLNEGGRCRVYAHRLLICRSHGVPAVLVAPNGQTRRFPGCFRCQEQVDAKYARPEAAPAVDRTALFGRLARLEQRFLGDDRPRYPKLRLTIADMIAQGPPRLPEV